jgi:alpha-beta hydrolase superfamily lysophospholipase
MIRWFEHRQVYSPSRKLKADASELGRSFEDVTFHAADGVRLHGWFFPADRSSPREHLVLLLLHGNDGNISHRLHFFQAWLELGVNVFAFDYRGFGRSEGRPDEEGTYRDAQAATQWLRTKGFAPEQIVLLGKSLGGGVAAELAVREPVGALILQNTFTSIPDIGSEMFPWLPVRRLHRIKYDTVSKLPRITVPVLVAHSPGDKLIAIRHAQRNFQAANEPKMYWELRGGHTGTIESGRDVYLKGLEKFFDEYLRQPPKK